MRTGHTLIHRIAHNLYGVLFSVAIVACDDEGNHPPADIRSELHKQINDLRKTGCMCGNEYMPPVTMLEWNVILEEAALDHATDMYVNDYFSHLSLDGKSPIDRAKNAGYQGDYTGEVIARKYYSVDAVVKAWQESESHCKALMDSLYNEVGGARKEDYWVVDLGN